MRCDLLGVDEQQDDYSLFLSGHGDHVCFLSIINDWRISHLKFYSHCMSLRYGAQQSSSKDLISFWASLNYCNNYQPHPFGDGAKLCLLNGSWNDNVVHYQSSIISLASFLKVSLSYMSGWRWLQKCWAKLYRFRKRLCPWSEVQIWSNSLKLN